MTRRSTPFWFAMSARLPLVAALIAAAPVDTRDTGAPLTVFAAASLTDAFRELGWRLEQQRPGLKVTFNFAGSQQLAVQLEQGAAADVFATADQRWMSYAQEHGLVEADPQVFTRNRLVVIVPKTNPARIAGLADLARRGTKIVLAAEAVPAGKYSREALHKLASASKFRANYDTRVLANVVSQEDNVKAVVAKVQLGEADAGIVYRSDVTPATSRYVRPFDIPDQYNVVASYPIALVKGAKNQEAAEAFISLVVGEEGQRVLGRNGFLPRSTSGPPSP